MGQTNQGPNFQITFGSNTQPDYNSIDSYKKRIDSYKENVEYVGSLITAELNSAKEILVGERLQFLMALTAATIRENVLFVGEYGEGKTLALDILVKRFASEEETANLNGGFAETRAASTGGSEINGIPIPGKINQKTLVVRLDEADKTNPDTINALIQMTGLNEKNRHVPIAGSSREFEAAFQIFSTANPRNNGDGTIRLSDAFISRFAPIQFDTPFKTSFIDEIYEKTLQTDQPTIFRRSDTDRQQVDVFQKQLRQYSQEYLPQNLKEYFKEYLKTTDGKIFDATGKHLSKRTLTKISRMFNALCLLNNEQKNNHNSEFSNAQLAVATFAGVSLTGEQIYELVFNQK